jgi:hypothetical protein
MREHLPILGRPARRMWEPKLLAGVLVAVLSMAASAPAQKTGSWSGASVDKSFSALNQALSATANDLLAGAQRPSAVPHTDRELPAASHVSSGFDSPATTRTQENIHLQQALDRVQALRPALEPILREEGIPEQMAAVVLVESGGQPTALSSMGARGLWQIMPATARRYGLVVSDRVDERLDPHKSTRAAARYLRDLYIQFGGWPLALAAYNAGEDAVQRAIVRTSSHDFNLIARAGMLPLETQNYVPAVLNAMDLIKSTARMYRTREAQKAVIDRVVYAMDHKGDLVVYE